MCANAPFRSNAPIRLRERPDAHAPTRSSSRANAPFGSNVGVVAIVSVKKDDRSRSSSSSPARTPRFGETPRRTPRFGRMHIPHRPATTCRGLGLFPHDILITFNASFGVLSSRYRYEPTRSEAKSGGGERRTCSLTHSGFGLFILGSHSRSHPRQGCGHGVA